MFAVTIKNNVQYYSHTAGKKGHDSCSRRIKVSVFFCPYRILLVNCRPSFNLRLQGMIRYPVMWSLVSAAK